MAGVLVLVVLAVCWQSITAAMNMSGCNYIKPFPLVFDGLKQPKGDIYSPGFDEGAYPDHVFCDYVIEAPPGHIVKLTFKEMQIESASRCGKDKLYVIDGRKRNGEDLGAYCGMEPPDYPVLSTVNGMFLSFITNQHISRKGFHAQYEVLKPEAVCPRGYLKCRNNNCYHPNQKCDGEDDCKDGTDEENCNRPLPAASCGNGNILPIETIQSPDRIVGGIEARPGSWPWQVDLQNHKFHPEAHQCGGTLINAQWVMTAQHCFMAGARPQDWKIIVGNHHRFLKDPDEQVRLVTMMIVYPGLIDDQILGKPIDIAHDIALMKLNAPVKFSDRVRPACLPPQGYELPLRYKCIASGWGETRGSGSHEALKQAELYTQLATRCASMSNQTMICTHAERSMQDACHGDSGGPLNCKIGDKYHVMGITSFGSTTNMMSGLCAVGRMGTVFNKVSAKVAWINAMIDKYS